MWVFKLSAALAALLLSSHLSWAQTCSTTVQKTTPDSDFTRQSDGTVTHLKTRLVWQPCELGKTWEGAHCTGTAQTYTWSAALMAATQNHFAGLNDWRVPNRNELQSIVEYGCNGPSINLSVFPNADSSVVWSSSPSAYSSNHAWYVYFNYGHVDGYYKYDSSQVRLVRGGQ